MKLNNCSRLEFERFEYLGDAVLQLIAAEVCLSGFPNSDSGILTNRRTSMNSNERLRKLYKFYYGEEDYFIKLKLGEPTIPRSRPNSKERKKVNADYMEAEMGYVYFNEGMDAARALFTKWNNDVLLSDDDLKPNDYLQELCIKVFNVRFSIHRDFYTSVVIKGKTFHSAESEEKVLIESIAKIKAMQKE